MPRKFLGPRQGRCQVPVEGVALVLRSYQREERHSHQEGEDQPEVVVEVHPDRQVEEQVEDHQVVELEEWLPNRRKESTDQEQGH